MSKLYFEMTEAEAQLTNIFKGLEYAHYQLSTGINGYSNGLMTEEERRKTEGSTLNALESAMSGVKKLIEEYAALEEEKQLEDGKPAAIAQYQVSGSEELVDLKGYKLVEVEDCSGIDRKTGEQQEITALTFRNDNGEYISASLSDDGLFMSQPHR